MRPIAQGNALCLPPHRLHVNMISVQTALSLIELHRPSPMAEMVAIVEAMGQTLAHDVNAGLSMPPFAASNMDGYALTSCETADRILIQEEAIRDGDRVTVKTRPKAGKHIRKIGSDFQIGEPLFKSNHHLQASDLTLLAAAGHQSVSVQSKRRIAIFSTGNELRPVGEPLKAGEVYASNNIGLKPWMAKNKAQIAFGLPGNPASSFVCAHLFLRTLLGQSPQILSAKLDGKIGENGPRETYLRGHAAVKDGQIEVTPFPLQVH